MYLYICLYVYTCACKHSSSGPGSPCWASLLSGLAAAQRLDDVQPGDDTWTAEDFQRHLLIWIDLGLRSK